MKATALYGRELWMLNATDNDGQTWTAKAESCYEAACALAGLMGLRWKIGESRR